MAFWTRNDHLIVDADGHPIDCPWCPCGPSGCDEIIEQQIARCEQDGAYYLHRTGFLYSTTDAALPVIASIFHWISWTFDNVRQIYVCRLNYLNCDCETGILATADFAAPPATPDLFGFGFIASEDACSGDCAAEIATLIAQAVVNGWTLHGEGLLVQKTSAAYECCRFDLSKIAVTVCADTGSSFIYVTCDCTRSEVTAANYPRYVYLEYAACRCLDIRELLLTFPDVFGVDDVSFGDDTVYTRDRSQSGGSIYTYSCLDHSTSYDTWYCDYRHLFVIFDNTKIGMSSLTYYGYTPDMFLLMFDTNARWLDGGGDPLKYDDVTDGSLYFDGKMPPFTNADEARAIWPHASSGMTWNGLTIRWIADTMHQGEEYGVYWSQADAQAAVDMLNANPDSYRHKSYDAECSTDIFFFPPMASFTPPDYTATPQPARKVYNQDEMLWYVYEPYYDFPNGGSIYNLNFIQTNRGFLINGQSGYHATLEVAGFTDSLSHWTSPPSEADILTQYQTIYTRCDDFNPCPKDTIINITSGLAIQSIPMYDVTFAIAIDESMGGCMGPEWWEAVMAGEDSDSSSEE